MLQRLVGVCLGPGVLSKGVLGWAEKMSPFTPDEERPRHGTMSTEAADGRRGKRSCRINLQECEMSALSRHVLEPHTLRCHTPVGACSVTMPKLEVSLTNTACHLQKGFRAFIEDNPAVVLPDNF